VQYLTADEIVLIHDKIVAATGGSLGVREPGLLVSIANKPQTCFGDMDLYPDIVTKAASLYEALCNYHVFIDGNKRAAAITMYRFLTINGYDLTATNKQLEDYTVYIATKNPEIESVAAWLKKHSQKA
jgi:death-on-curing protein